MEQDVVRCLPLFLGVRVKQKENSKSGTLVDLREYDLDDYSFSNEGCAFGVEWDDGTYNDRCPFRILDLLDEDPIQVYTHSGDVFADPYGKTLMQIGMHNPKFKVKPTGNNNTLSALKREFTRLGKVIEAGNPTLKQIERYNACIEYRLNERIIFDWIGGALTARHFNNVPRETMNGDIEF